MRSALAAFALAVSLLFLTTGRGVAADDEAIAGDEQVLKEAHLGTDGPALLSFFRTRTVPDADREQIANLVRQLGARDLAARDQASGRLVALGSVAVPLLRQAAKDPDDGEVAGRARQCLALIDGPQATGLSAAAARLLAVHHPAQTAAVLLAYLPYSEDDTVVEEAENALAAVLRPPAVPDPAVPAALTDPVPIRRAVAASALARADQHALLPRVRPLLRDPKPTVRLRVALALANQHEEAAIPVLIGALADAPLPYALRAQTYLRDLAGPIGLDRFAPVLAEASNRAGRDACRAAWAEWWRKHDGPALLELLRKGTPSEADRRQVEKLIDQLGDDDFAVRARASEDLQAMGERAVPQLRLAMRSPDAEVVRRAQNCLAKLGEGNAAAVPVAVARLLAFRRPAGTAEALLAYVPYIEDEDALAQFQTALDLVTVRDGRVNEVVTRALDDPLAPRRAAAGVALCRVGGPEQRPAVGRLLDDRDPRVRLRVALALVEARDKQAVRPLIALLGELPPEQLGRADDVLRALAGSRAPDVALGQDPAARQRCRDAWLAWWVKNEAGVDLARLDHRSGPLGLTLICLGDFRGGFEVVEVGANGQPRWRIDGIQYAMDAQVLPGRRVLITEYQGQRVTERNLKGEVLWEKRLPQNPIAAQRLPNGHTFIAMQFQLLEVDRAGKEVFTHPLGGQPIMAAFKGRDGHITCLTQQGMLLRLDATGKQVKSFHVGFPQIFCGIHVLGNGHVVLPLYGQGKVVEYDADGKSVWEAPVQMPSSAQRLANGHTLVACQNSQRVVELDREGKTVWEYHAQGRPWRAHRR